MNGAGHNHILVALVELGCSGSNLSQSLRLVALATSCHRDTSMLVVWIRTTIDHMAV